MYNYLSSYFLAGSQYSCLSEIHGVEHTCIHYSWGETHSTPFWFNAPFCLESFWYLFQILSDLPLVNMFFAFLLCRQVRCSQSHSSWCQTLSCIPYMYGIDHSLWYSLNGIKWMTCDNHIVVLSNPFLQDPDTWLYLFMETCLMTLYNLARPVIILSYMVLFTNSHGFIHKIPCLTCLLFF